MRLDVSQLVTASVAMGVPLSSQLGDVHSFQGITLGLPLPPLPVASLLAAARSLALFPVRAAIPASDSLSQTRRSQIAC